MIAPVLESLPAYVIYVPTPGQVVDDRAWPDPRPVAPKKRVNPKPAVVKQHSGWEEAARICIVHRESRGNPRAQNRHSTASGLYQFIDGTWHNFRGYRHAKDAPPSVQTERFWQVWNHGKGRNNWYLRGGPQCW